MHPKASAVPRIGGGIVWDLSVDRCAPHNDPAVNSVGVLQCTQGLPWVLLSIGMIPGYYCRWSRSTCHPGQFPLEVYFLTHDLLWDWASTPPNHPIETFIASTRWHATPVAETGEKIVQTQLEVCGTAPDQIAKLKSSVDPLTRHAGCRTRKKQTNSPPPAETTLEWNVRTVGSSFYFRRPGGPLV